MKTVNFISYLPTLTLQMDYSLEEISKGLHGFCRKFVAANARSLTLIKTKSYWLAKINKLQQTGGQELQNPLGFLIIKGILISI